jgi:hypothetical protein
MHILIHVITHYGIVIASNPARINSQLTVSKAFLQSIFMAQLGGPLLRWELCISSCVSRIASDIFRHGRKAYCEGPMISSKAFFNLETIILDMHLYRTLQQEIGRKSFMQDGFSTLGTRATLVALTQRGRELLVKKYLVAAMKSTPIIDQHFLKKKVL